jgi:hypothetical protein
MRIYDYIQNKDVADCIKALFNRPRALGKCGLAGVAATDDQDVLTANAIDFVINGKVYTLAITAVIDLSATTAGLAATAATAGAIQAGGMYAAYLLTVNAAGTIDCLKGADATTAALALAVLPAPAVDTCPFGIFVVTNTTNAFIVGTTKDSATGVSFAFYDICDIPSGYGVGAVYNDTVTE